ncbi:MAG: hypothetical protein GKS07_00480 [Nitrosopumilus sp.]|nr:MAG: hypothetical protein GKS07_00480 [Nitrosopumilus sp.]
MTSLERRVAELEGKTARLESMLISAGKSEPKHLGKKTKQVLIQELKSHEQSLQETFNAHEKAEWDKKLLEIKKELSEL